MRPSTMGTLRDNSLPATPRRIRLISSGEILDFYSGAPYQAAGGITVQTGSYVGSYLIASHAWVMSHLTLWEPIAEPFPIISH